jgi:hypothetical protein
MGLTHLSIFQGHPFPRVTAVAEGKSLITHAISPNVAAYEAYFKGSNASLSLRCVASESIFPSEAVAYVQGRGIRLIEFGAFSRQQTTETMELIQGGVRA